MLPRIGTRLAIKRAILSVLQPLTGDRATGSLLVKATGADVPLSANSYLFAIPRSAGGNQGIDPTLLYKVVKDDTFTEVPTNGDTDWTITVTAAGVAVPVVSVLGGVQHNVTTPGMRFRFNPVPAGIVPEATLVDPGFSGATDPSFAGGLRRIVLFERLGKSAAAADVAYEIWRARLGGPFPAAVLVLVSSDRGELQGPGMRLRKFTWWLVVYSTTYASAPEREEEGDAILEYAEALLGDRSSVDDEVFSQPKMQVTGSRLLVTTPDGATVHILTLESSSTICRIEGREFEAWAESQVQLVTPPDAEHPAPADPLIVAQVDVAQ